MKKRTVLAVLLVLLTGGIMNAQDLETKREKAAGNFPRRNSVSKTCRTCSGVPTGSTGRKAECAPAPQHATHRMWTFMQY